MGASILRGKYLLFLSTLTKAGGWAFGVPSSVVVGMRRQRRLFHLSIPLVVPVTKPGVLRE